MHLFLEAHRSRHRRPASATVLLVAASLLSTASATEGDASSEPVPPIARSKSTPMPSGIDPKSAPIKPLDLGKTVIAAAVAEAKDVDERPTFVRSGTFGNTKPTAQQKIDRAFKEAEIPTCMTMDAWKFEPPHIGPIMITGLLAAPWLVHVIATGRCRH